MLFEVLMPNSRPGVLDKNFIAVNFECRCRGNFDTKPIYSFLVAVNFDQVYIFFQNQVYISFSIMNSVEESLVSRTAIDALLEESDSKIDETIRGLKDFLVNIDGAVRKLLPLAVYLLGTDNEALLIPANILP